MRRHPGCFSPPTEYEQRVKFAIAEGVVRRQLMGDSQLIPVYVQRCFAQHYYQRQVLTAEELLNAREQLAGYSTAVGQMVRERAATEIRRVVLSKIVLCMSARPSRNIFARIRKSALYTGLATGSTFLARRSHCRSIGWMVFRLRIFVTACVWN